jgi:hypothetical protein
LALRDYTGQLWIRPVEHKLLKQRQRLHADLCEYVDRQAVVLPFACWAKLTDPILGF